MLKQEEKKTGQRRSITPRLDFRIIVTEIVEDSKRLRSVRRDPHAIELAFFLLLDNDEAGHALPLVRIR